jgi:hypothetical protein
MPAIATTISTGALTGGEWASFGQQATPIYGEVFTAPISGTLLSFTLYLNPPNFGDPVSALYGAVSAWNGSGINSIAWQSSTIPGGSSSFTFSPTLSVTAGQQYVAFLSVYGLSSFQSFGIGQMPIAAQGSSFIDGFTFWGYSGTPFTSAWSWPASANPEFNWVEFSATIDPTPLPTALPLFATGIGALGLLGWRRKRKAQVT